MGLLPPIVAELTAQNTEFMAAMAESKAAMDDVSESGGSSFESLAASGGVMAAAVGAALIGVGGIALDLGVKYQAATAQLAASADISVAAATRIGDAFLTTGGSSVYSAQEMMEAYSPVAAELGLLAGHALTAAQALSFMKTASDLAEASGTSLSDATSVLAATMQAYQLKLSDANEVSNILFNTSRLTGQSLDALDKVILRLHSSLGDLTPPLSQVGGLMVDLTAHGESGRQAISGVNSAMTTLIGSFKAGQTTVSSTTIEIDQLGLTVFNAQGKFVGLGSIIGQLHDKFAGMNQEQQQLAATNLFGAGAAAKMIEVIDAGPPAFDKYTAEVDKAGSTQDAANKKAQDFEEQLKRIEVEVEDAGVRLGEWLLPKVETLTHDLIDGVTWLDHHRDALYALAAVAGGYATVAIGAFIVNGIENLSTKLVSGAEDLVNFGAKMLGLDAPFAATETEAETTATTVSSAAETMQSSMAELTAAIQANTDAISASLTEIDTSMETVATGFEAETTGMEADYAAMRAELETPIVMPPVEGGALEAGAAGAETAVGGTEAAVGAGEAGVGATEAGVGATEAGVGVTEASASGIGSAMGDVVAPVLASAVAGVLTNVLIKRAEGPDTVKSTTAGTVTAPGAEVVTQVQDHTANSLLGDIVGLIPGIGPSLKNALDSSDIATVKGQQSAAAALAALMARSTDIKALQTSVQTMSTLFGTTSTEAQNARQQLLAAEMKWVGIGAKDSTLSTQISAVQGKIEAAQAAATADSVKLDTLVAKDGTVQDLKTGIADEKTTLHADIQAGNTQGAANAQRQINTFQTELGKEQTVMATLSKDTTMAKVDQDLLTQLQSDHTDLTALQKKLDGVTIAHIVGQKATGSIKCLF